MPEIHIPQLDHDETALVEPAAPAPGGLPHGKTIIKIVLEVALISMGVFLGLLGEQWRQSSEHRASEQASLRQFRTEILDNRKAVAAVLGYHADVSKKLDLYLSSDRSKKSDVEIHGVRPVTFEQTAWDLSLATQSLAYMDPDVAFAISRAYDLQHGLASVQTGILPSIYSSVPSMDGLGAYFNDVSYQEPELLKAYDVALRKIDQAIDKYKGH